MLDDVLILRAGDQVTADASVLESQGLEADESILSGESVVAIDPSARCWARRMLLLRAGDTLPDTAAHRLARAVAAKSELKALVEDAGRPETNKLEVLIVTGAATGKVEANNTGTKAMTTDPPRRAPRPAIHETGSSQLRV